ncbi:aromatic prenyltransferase [Streptomyces sp. NPDC087420]|uniref:aromatic prenyltransferase n=1 Tax=Streptomyces sp. NPDC087420 TaxID=3365785 RepID=UPI00383480E9
MATPTTTTAPTTRPTPLHFLEDIRSTAAAVGAPFDEEVTRKALAAYAGHFLDSAVVWKTTGRPGDDLSYRFYTRTRTDTLSTATAAGLLPPDTPLAPLIAFWSDLYDGAPEQSCDFTARTGLDKTWVWLGGTRPAAEVLDAEAVPDALRRNLPAFARAGLAHIRFLAVDHRHHSVNLYFRVRGPVTAARCADIVSLVGVTPPSAEDVAEMGALMPRDYGISVTVSLTTGDVARVCFYALNVPDGRLPRIPERIATFLAAAPSYDAEGCTVIGWSYGPGNGTYVKAERSCYGDMISAFERWSCHFSGGRERDSALPV